MGYYIKAILLNDCKFSIKAGELLNNIKSEITNIDANQKEKYKNDYIKTFPQIYFCNDKNSNCLLIGGYTELKKIMNTFKGVKLNDDNIENFMRDNNEWTKKIKLRLIKHINNITDKVDVFDMDKIKT